MRARLALALVVVARAVVARAVDDVTLATNASAIARASATRESDVTLGGWTAETWYAATAFRSSWYVDALGVDRGRAVDASDASALFAALSDPTVETVRLTSAATLRADAWPRRGVVVRRRVTLRGACGSPCVVDGLGERSLASVVDGGSLTMSGVRVRRAAAANGFGGGVYFGRAHGGGEVSDVVFEDCDASEGGAVFVASGSGTGRVIFRNVTFLRNRATGARGRGGAAFASVAGPNRVIFDDCAFVDNTATNGFGGGVYGHGGYVVVNACNFTRNVAATGGGVAMNRGGVVSSTLFFSNEATTSTGGGLHIISPSDVVSGNRASSVQRTTFVNNTARVAGGGAFAYGRVRMLANSFAANVIGPSATSGLNADYYVCTNTTSSGCSLVPTLAGDVYDPAKHDPFTPEADFATVS